MVTGLMVQPGVKYLYHGACSEKPVLLRADGTQLSEKGKNNFGHRLDKQVKRALSSNWWIKGTLIYPTPVSFMPVSE